MESVGGGAAFEGGWEVVRVVRVVIVESDVGVARAALRATRRKKGMKSVMCILG